ncbi:MAG: hypothetical protein ACR2PZ_18080 [Pseudomonadales bacterium]
MFDAGRNLVANGQLGGDPVELERGVYRVVVNSQPQQSFSKVEVQASLTWY